MTEPCRILDARGDVPIVLTCEHASNQLPEPWRWPDADRWITQTHWAFDSGAAALTEALAARLGVPAALAGFSRLLVDPNRPLESPTLFRDRADGQRIALNETITDADRLARIDGYWRPFHASVDALVSRHAPRLLLSIHSFTPVYEGTPRSVEVGVLHADQPALAAAWRDALARHGYDVRVDEPYVGAGGFIYSAESHAEKAGCPAIELEFRQDLLRDPLHFARLLDAVSRSATGLV